MFRLVAEWKTYKDTLKETRRTTFYVVDTLETILVALLLALLISRYVIGTSKVFSGSMEPTMMVKDKLVVNRFIYRFRDPKRSAIILFKSPRNDGKEYVKRLVGLPSDTIEIRQGVVFINGNQHVFPGVNVQRDPYDFYGPEVVPENNYFVLGDNRGNSSDSRVWGFVPRKDIIGKALFTFWPLNRIQILQ
ncbi:MAG: signal peptidase I [Candidatus Margulisbacteria bacterium]|nr:signal peptidase I [Candidatus Margulisiibacteriota bacterium]